LFHQAWQRWQLRFDGANGGRVLVQSQIYGAQQNGYGTFCTRRDSEVREVEASDTDAFKENCASSSHLALD